MSQKPSKKLFVITEQALNFLQLWMMVALPFECLFGLKFTPRSNVEFMYTIDRYKWWGRCSLSKIPDLHALSLQKIRPKMDICCHICAGVDQSSISSLGRVQKCLRPWRLINFYSRRLFPQMHWHKPLDTLSMKRFWRIRSISSASSQAHSWCLWCHGLWDESSPFSSYSIML